MMKKMQMLLLIIGRLLIVIAGVLIVMAWVLNSGQLNIIGGLLLMPGIILNAIIESKRRRERQRNDDIDDTKE